MSLKVWAIGISIVVIIAVIIGLLAGSVRDLDPNEVAFDYDHNVGLIVDDTTLYEGGRHFLGLGHDFVVFPKTVQSLVIPTQEVRSSDGLAIELDMTVQYLFSPLNATTLKNIYYSFEEDYERVFTFHIEAVARDISSLYNASDFYERRADIQQSLKDSLKTVFASYAVSIDDLQLVNTVLPDDLSTEIQNTELAKQDSLKAAEERDVQQGELDTRIGQSYGDIAILFQDRDTQVNLTLTSAYSQADTIKSIYILESTALAYVLSALNLTNDEFQAYMFLKSLEDTGATLHMSIPFNQQLIN